MPHDGWRVADLVRRSTGLIALVIAELDPAIHLFLEMKDGSPGLGAEPVIGLDPLVPAR